MFSWCCLLSLFSGKNKKKYHQIVVCWEWKRLKGKAMLTKNESEMKASTNCAFWCKWDQNWMKNKQVIKVDQNCFYELHHFEYRIRPNYRTVRSGFSKFLKTLICGKICIYLLRIHYKKDQKRTYLMMTMPFFLIFFIKAYVVGTRLNCIDKSMQFKWVPTT